MFCKLWLCCRHWLGAHVNLIRSSHHDLAMLTGGKKPRWHLAHAHSQAEENSMPGSLDPGFTACLAPHTMGAGGLDNIGGDHKQLLNPSEILIGI